MKTLTAPTATDLTVVVVNRDSLEMGKSVLVCDNNVKQLSTASFRNHLDEPVLQMYFHPSDINECSADPSPCDVNADCINSDGSYSCTCKQGFTGNGTVCEGND